MNSSRGLLRSLWIIITTILLISIVASPHLATMAQETIQLTVMQASIIAHDHMLREENTIPSWKGAEIRSPKVHYDLDGTIAAYVFSVVKDNRDLGYITVSSQDLPNSVLEFSTTPARYKTTQLAVRLTAERLGLVIDEQKPLYLGMLAYFYRIGNQKPIQIVEMNTQRIVSIDSSSLALSQEQISNTPNTTDILSNSLLNEASHSSFGVQSTYFKLLYGPDYSWNRGCGPTAVANAMGYWADRGYPNLVYGGSEGDFQGTIDQLVTLMGTSPEGWTWLPINDDINSFALSRGYSFQSNETYGPSYSAFVDEINAHRPIVILVNGHILYGNHFITGFGYEYDPSDPSFHYMIVHDTWGSTPEEYWVQYGTGYSSIWFDTVVPPSAQPDTIPPTSAVNSLSVYQTLDTFRVSWSGNDEGWGIKWYDIQYRDTQNGGWTNWVTQTTTVWADFSGSKSHTYCFRSRAMDIDHNQESYLEREDRCTTVLPSLAINYQNGKPGSFFTLNGAEYPPSATVTVTINGHYLGNVTTDSTGSFRFILNTSAADEGGYWITTNVNFNVAVVFWLDPSAPFRSQEGSGTIFYVPNGAALSEFINLPLVRR